MPSRAFPARPRRPAPDVGFARVPPAWFVASALAGAACAPPARSVVIASPEQAPPGVTVTGEGEASAAPDVARLSLGVESRAASVEQASDDANARVRAIIAALKAAGVAERDLRTNHLSLRREIVPPYPYPIEPPPAAPMAAPAGPRSAPMKPPSPPVASAAPAAPPRPAETYVASNSLDVRLRDLGRAGEVIAAATRAGANELGGPFFSREDTAALEREAREKAVRDARQRAEHLARLAGVRLGPVVSIHELTGGEGTFPQPMAAGRMMAVSVESGGVPLERGEVRVTRRVQVRFALPERD